MNCLFERDLLYPTSNIFEPGIIHLKVLNPTSSNMPLIIESKSNHCVVQYLKDIIDVMQKDVFDRINIKIEKNTSLYILLCETESNKYDGAKYLKVIFNADKYGFSPVNEIV